MIVKLGDFGSSTSIALTKFATHFNASHMVVTPYYEEGIHGHSYYISIEIYGDPDDTGMLIDFIYLEKVLKESIKDWDHYVLLPKYHPLIHITDNGPNVDIRYRDRYYSIPQSDITFLECENITAENLVLLLANKIHIVLKKEIPNLKLSELKVDIWETPIYSASHTIHYK